MQQVTFIRNLVPDKENKFGELCSCFLSCCFRAGWHRVGLYKVLSSMDFHVIAVDYRGKDSVRSHVHWFRFKLYLFYSGY